MGRRFVPFRKASNNGPLETEVQAGIQRDLRMLGFTVKKVNTTGIYVKARNTYIKNPSEGMADLMILLNGGFIAWVEIKRPGKKSVQRDSQIEFEEEVTSIGHVYGIATNTEEALEVIKRAIDIYSSWVGVSPYRLYKNYCSTWNKKEA